MIKHEPPYSVHMLDGEAGLALCDSGSVYSSGNPGEARAFARGLCETGARAVEVRDAAGRLVWRFPMPSRAVD